MSDSRRVTLNETDCDDSGLEVELAELDREERELAAQAGLFSGTGDTHTAGEPVAPFDVEVPRPRAVSLKQLYKLLDREVPPEMQAIARNRAPLLIHQGLTAFNPPGRAPASVWGLGYEIRLEDVDADTVSIEPSTKLRQVARLDQNVKLSLSAGGEFRVAPPETPMLDRKATGIALQGVELGASTTQGFELGLSFRFELLKIEAGP